MGRSKLQQTLYDLLKDHNSDGFQFTLQSVCNLTVVEMESLHYFLTNNPFFEDTGIERPECPTKPCEKKKLHQIPEYKAGVSGGPSMNDYLDQWGFRFDRPSQIPIVLFEVTANYLESYGSRIH